jgi:hypothetical protein
MVKNISFLDGCMGRLKFPEFLLPLFGRFYFRILCSAPYKGLIKDSPSKNNTHGRLNKN